MALVYMETVAIIKGGWNNRLGLKLLTNYFQTGNDDPNMRRAYEEDAKESGEQRGTIWRARIFFLDKKLIITSHSIKRVHHVL